MLTSDSVPKVFVMIAFGLLWLGEPARAIDIYALHAFGVKSSMSLREVVLILEKSRFQGNSSLLEGVENGRLVVYSRGADSLSLLTSNNQLLEILSPQIEFNGNILSQGLERKRVILLLGRPDHIDRDRDSEDFQYNDSQHEGSFSVKLRGQKVVQFRLTPGWDRLGPWWTRWANDYAGAFKSLVGVLLLGLFLFMGKRGGKSAVP